MNPSKHILQLGLLTATATFPFSSHAGAGAAAPPPACSGNACPSLAAVVLDNAARQAIREAARAGSAAETAVASAKAPAVDDAWDRQLGAPAGQEAYNCALSFGIGGAVAADGFIGTRVFGRTRAWRGDKK